jgi:hypothetical protein
MQLPLRILVLVVLLPAGLLRGQDIPPGVIIDRSPHFARVYVTCPSIAVMPESSYGASHSWFGPGTIVLCPGNRTTPITSRISASYQFPPVSCPAMMSRAF